MLVDGWFAGNRRWEAPDRGVLTGASTETEHGLRPCVASAADSRELGHSGQDLRQTVAGAGPVGETRPGSTPVIALSSSAGRARRMLPRWRCRRRSRRDGTRAGCACCCPAAAATTRSRCTCSGRRRSESDLRRASRYRGAARSAVRVASRRRDAAHADGSCRQPSVATGRRRRASRNPALRLAPAITLTVPGGVGRRSPMLGR
jgi:hypothetical protein